MNAETQSKLLEGLGTESAERFIVWIHTSYKEDVE